MKILYMNTLGTWGGVATYLHALIKDQVHRGNQVYLIVGSKGKLTIDMKEHFPSVKIILLPNLKRNIHIVDTLKAIFQFRKIVKKIKPDIIHLNCMMSGIVGRLGAIGLHQKIVYNAHGWDFEPRVSRKLRLLAIIIEKILAYFTDTIICVSNYEYKIASKYHIFKNDHQGVIIKNAAPKICLNSSNKLNDNVYRITMAARFIEPKNQYALIKSFFILDKELLPDKRLRLYLLGDGPTLDRCKQLSKDLDIDNNIVFTGEVNDVLDYYNQSDIVTLITNSDAISLSLIEALSVGKPLVASDVTGIPETFDHNGYCVPNKIHAIADAFQKIILNKDLRIQMGINSKRLFNKEFLLSKNLNAHNELYLSLMKD